MDLILKLVQVAQDVLDVTLQSKGGRYRSSSAAMSLIAQQASEMAISAEEQLPHSLLLLAATRGVEFERTVRAARGEPLPIPGVPYGETPNKPVPEAMQKVRASRIGGPPALCVAMLCPHSSPPARCQIVAGMQKVAKGWMQKKEYKRQKAASRIQAFVRGRAARKEVDRMRAAAGLPPLQYVQASRPRNDPPRVPSDPTED